MKYNTYCGSYSDRGNLMLAILDWVLEEHLSGSKPNDLDVSKHFNIPIEEAILLHEELEEMGEFE